MPTTFSCTPISQANGYRVPRAGRPSGNTHLLGLYVCPTLISAARRDLPNFAVTHQLELQDQAPYSEINDRIQR
jgi:hypothetical protein